MTTSAEATTTMWLRIAWQRQRDNAHTNNAVHLLPIGAMQISSFAYWNETNEREELNELVESAGWAARAAHDATNLPPFRSPVTADHQAPFDNPKKKKKKKKELWCKSLKISSCDSTLRLVFRLFNLIKCSSFSSYSYFSSAWQRATERNTTQEPRADSQPT